MELLIQDKKLYCTLNFRQMIVTSTFYKMDIIRALKAAGNGQ